GLARSSDGGDTWDLMRTPVPSGFVDMVAGSSSRVFAAAYDGVYASFDDGRTWSQISSFRSLTIAVSPDERTILALDPWTPALHEIPVDAPETGRLLPRIAPSPQYIGAIAVSSDGTVYATTATGEETAIPHPTVRMLRANSSTWEEIPGFPQPSGLASGTRMAFDESGFLYVPTSGSGIVRSRVPVEHAATDVARGGVSIESWQAGPPPFSARTAFGLRLTKAATVSLSLFDVRGRVVTRLWEATPLPAGSHSATWSPQATLPSGTYFYELVTGDARR